LIFAEAAAALVVPVIAAVFEAEIVAHFIREEVGEHAKMCRR
jgi:hypothetical protein